MVVIEFPSSKDLYYIEHGEGQPVIFIHGTLDDFRPWRLQIDQFADLITGQIPMLVVTVCHEYDFVLVLRSYR